MKRFIFLLCSLPVCMTAFAQEFVLSATPAGGFPVLPATNLSIYADSLDDWLVNKTAALLQSDIERITGKKPPLINTLAAATQNTIVIGTIGGSSAIKQFIAQKKINVHSIQGKWEAFQVETIDAVNTGHMLVITGSDKRGAAYGVFELSKQLGISPWYWWADVPAKNMAVAAVKKGRYVFPSPSIQYRGIFINDEAPAFSGWTKEKFGGFNHLVYEKMFELLLRLKANYLWPAMWGNAFNDDDTLNPVLANQWGIVMGTSHHEPMLRAQAEWKRYGKGAWDYTKNDTTLREFWQKGMQNMRDHESIVTIGMRGDGDMPMTQGTAIPLLEKIVSDQRKIIETTTGKPAAQTPQVWALYKEVQDYYDNGMRVPDDVTLLLCDDNWGNIRKLPARNDTTRKGGFGIYYHFDYVGGPRNYKWINTNNISRVWEQMHLADAYGVKKIWIVNVGDLKPMELPISFFLDYAYNTKKWNPSNITRFFENWASDQFGDAHAKTIAAILRKYSLYASRRKPEMLDANTYSVQEFNEFEKVLRQWAALKQQAEKLAAAMPAAYQDAFFELVLHPVLAFENLHQLYYAVAMNKLYAAKNDVLANQWADKAKRYYLYDSLLTVKYNKELAGGKWSHMMDQTHIGYTYWQQPARNSMPAVTYTGNDTAMQATNVSVVTYDENAPSATANRFTEKDGYISIGATHYSRAVENNGVTWTIIPDIGKHGDGITTFPVTTGTELAAKSPHLEYEINTKGKDSLHIAWHFSPTLNFLHSATGLRFAVSIDNQSPDVIGLNKEDNSNIWNAWVGNNTIVKTSTHFIAAPGKHVLKYWMIDPGIVLQAITASFAAMPSGYLTPPETNQVLNNK